MTKEIRSPNVQKTSAVRSAGVSFGILHSLGLRHLSFGFGEMEPLISSRIWSCVRPDADHRSHALARASALVQPAHRIFRAAGFMAGIKRRSTCHCLAISV